MQIEKKNDLHKMCNLTLPLISPDVNDGDHKNSDAAQRMNEFYDKLREEIISYVDGEGKNKIRRYITRFDVNSENGSEMTIRVMITARINSESGHIISKKKTLVQKWKNGLLNDFQEII